MSTGDEKERDDVSDDKVQACVHQWEPTGFSRVFIGTKWQQIAEVRYCALCNRFGSRTTVFLDGDFCKEAELLAIRQEEQAIYEANKAAYLAKRNGTPEQSASTGD